MNQTTSIVVRPAGPTRDAAGAALDSARRALARGQTGVAITRLEQLLDNQPDLAEARILLARTLLASGRPRRAEALLATGWRARRTITNSPSGWRATGWNRTARGGPGNARGALAGSRRSARLSPAARRNPASARTSRSRAGHLPAHQRVFPGQRTRLAGAGAFGRRPGSDQHRTHRLPPHPGTRRCPHRTTGPPTTAGAGPGRSAIA